MAKKIIKSRKLIVIERSNIRSFFIRVFHPLISLAKTKKATLLNENDYAAKYGDP